MKISAEAHARFASNLADKYIRPGGEDPNSGRRPRTQRALATAINRACDALRLLLIDVAENNGALKTRQLRAEAALAELDSIRRFVRELPRAPE